MIGAIQKMQIWSSLPGFVSTGSGLVPARGLKSSQVSSLREHPPTQNVMTVRVFKTRPDGDFRSKPEELRLELGDQTKIPLAGEWRGRVSMDARPHIHCRRISRISQRCGEYRQKTQKYDERRIESGDVLS